MKIYLDGFESLSREMQEYHGIDPDLWKTLFHAPVQRVIMGQSDLDTELGELTLNSTSRIEVARALQKFDQAVTMDPELNFPDPLAVEDEGAVEVDTAGFLTNAKKAWLIVREEDNYISAIFCLTFLVGVFLSSYTKDELGGMDFSALRRVFSPLKTAFTAKEYEYGYETDS